jgi:hypothetical protein
MMARPLRANGYAGEYPGERDYAGRERLFFVAEREIHDRSLEASPTDSVRRCHQRHRGHAGGHPSATWLGARVRGRRAALRWRMVDDMSPQRVIPITRIMRRYQRLRKLPQAQRLQEARHLVEHPEELAEEFAASVAHFAPYANLNDHFYPPERAKREYAADVQRTNDLVLRLQEQGTLVPVDGASRLTRHAAGAGVTAVPAADLTARYVDRELLVQRTTSPAEWEDGTHNRGGVRLDVLLADVASRRPIVAELKLPGDMDPFFALIQALACAAHLATHNQYERMRRHLHRGKFPELADAPPLDIWVLSVDPADHDPSQPPKGRYMADLRKAADNLAPKLLVQDAITASICRIAALGMRLDGAQVAADVNWAWQRSSP